MFRLNTNWILSPDWSIKSPEWDQVHDLQVRGGLHRTSVNDPPGGHKGLFHWQVDSQGAIRDDHLSASKMKFPGPAPYVCTRQVERGLHLASAH